MTAASATSNTPSKLFVLVYSQDDGTDTYMGGDIEKIKNCLKESLLAHTFDCDDDEMQDSLPDGIESTWTWKVMHNFMQNSVPGDVLHELDVVVKRDDPCSNRISMTHVNQPKQWKALPIKPIK
jgi:hypothetical protein